MGGIIMAALLGCFGLFMGGYWYAQGGWVMSISPVGIGAMFILAAVMDAYRVRPAHHPTKEPETE